MSEPSEVTQADIDRPAARAFGRPVTESDLDALDDAIFGPVGVAEAQTDRAVAGAFGRHVDAADPAVRQAFTKAGFSEEKVAQGLKLIESGRYLGFEDVATSLMLGTTAGLDAGNKPLAPGVTAGHISEAARWLAAKTDVSEAALDALDDAIFGPPDSGSVTGQ